VSEHQSEAEARSSHVMSEHQSEAEARSSYVTDRSSARGTRAVDR